MRVFINSFYRNYGDSHNFSISLSEPIQAKNIFVGSCIIPNVFDNVISEYNIIRFINSSNILIEGIIGIGKYIIADLISAIKSFMEFNDPLHVYSFVILPDNTIEIAINVGTFQLIVNNNSIYYLLGFRETTAVDNVVFSELPYNLDRTYQIIIESNISITSPNYRGYEKLSGLHNSANILDIIPIKNIEIINTGFNIITNDGTNNILPLSLNNNSYSELYLRLLDDRGRALDLKGFDWSIELFFNI